MASKKQTKIANRYSHALVKAVAHNRFTITESEKEELRELSVSLLEITKVIVKDHEAMTFFLNPTVEVEAKEKVLSNVLDSSKAKPILKSFFISVLRNGRFETILQMAESFLAETRKVLSILAVKITTSRELSDTEKSDLKNTIATQTKKDLEFHWNVNKDILGGIVVEYEGKRYDSSILGKLNGIQEQIG